jgi:hypothetical protein
MIDGTRLLFVEPLVLEGMFFDQLRKMNAGIDLELNRRPSDG